MLRYHLDYPFLKEHCEIKVINSSKRHLLPSDPKALQQNYFIENLDRDAEATMFTVLKEIKELYWIFQ